MKKAKRKLSATSRALVMFVFAAMLINLALGVLAARQAAVAIKAQIRSRMLDTVNTAADMLNGDVLHDLSPADAGTPEYEDAMQILTYFQDNIELEYIYCIRDDGGRRFSFGLDPTSDDPGDFGSPVVYTKALYQASRGIAAVDNQPYKDEWGTFYSAYSPVFDSTGRVAGTVAVDFSKEWYDKQISSLYWMAVIMGVVTFAIGVMLIMIVTGRNRSRFRTVNEQLNQMTDNLESLMEELEIVSGIGVGESGARTAPRRESDEPDDIDALKRKLAGMQRELHARIGRVRGQIYLDNSTGVMNKARYLRTKGEIDEMIREENAEFTVLIFSVNELKKINSAMGHDYGDVALRDVADALVTVYDQNRIFHIGGGEFIVITDNASESGIQDSLSKIDFRIATENVKEKPYKHALSLSMGYAAFRPESDKEYMDVYRRADRMMSNDKAVYNMKHGGR